MKHVAMKKFKTRPKVKKITKFQINSRAQRLADAVFKNNALLDRLKDKGIGIDELKFVDNDIVYSDAPSTGEAATAGRTERYGNYYVMAQISQRLKEVLRSRPGGWGVLRPDQLSDEQKESLELICMKMARIVCGDPNIVDSWVDIAGYAELAVKSIPNK